MKFKKLIRLWWYTFYFIRMTSKKLFSVEFQKIKNKLVEKKCLLWVDLKSSLYSLISSDVHLSTVSYDQHNFEKCIAVNLNINLNILISADSSETIIPPNYVTTSS